MAYAHGPVEHYVLVEGATTVPGQRCYQSLFIVVTGPYHDVIEA